MKRININIKTGVAEVFENDNKIAEIDTNENNDLIVTLIGEKNKQIFSLNEPLLLLVEKARGNII